ncbi:hypothetical protein ACNTMW_27445 [Planosporangium sp. 12N6]|uniref:YqeB family protein n=1 Tax=Planosporangium spinosum TaxID=3402278 RepID=UPI003CF78E30
MVSGERAGGRRGSADGHDGATVLGYPIVDRLVLFLGIPAALGLLFGFGLPAFARWLLGFSVPVPLGIVFRVFAAVDRPREVAVNAAVWVVVGLGIAVAALRTSAKVTLTGAELHLDHDDRTRTVARADIDAVFVDGKDLVVLDRESRQIFRGTHQASGAALAAAFRRQGYPWRDADPYADLYHRWVPGAGDLPPAVDAVLAARETALSKKSGRDARELRDAVEKLGFTVRDEGTRQYWRPLVRS